MITDKQLMVNNYSGWWHSIDCGDGVVTSGVKTAKVLAQEVANMQLPPLTGKTVLDIGAWDGFFSFLAEDLGASKVMALDHVAWSLDVENLFKMGKEGSAVKNPLAAPGIWKPEALPGKRGFDIVHKIRNSTVEQQVANIMTADLLSIGQFDVVFFLGVLYHLEEPLTALKRIHALTREMVVIETHAIFLPEYEDNAFLEFYEGDRLNGDPTNQFGVNANALKGMCRQVGFRNFKITSPYPPTPDASSDVGNRLMYRLTLQAFK